MDDQWVGKVMCKRLQIWVIDWLKCWYCGKLSFFWWKHDKVSRYGTHWSSFFHSFLMSIMTISFRKHISGELEQKLGIRSHKAKYGSLLCVNLFSQSHQWWMWARLQIQLKLFPKINHSWYVFFLYFPFNIFCKELHINPTIHGIFMPTYSTDSHFFIHSFTTKFCLAFRG